MDEALVAAIEDAHNTGAGVWREQIICKLEDGRLGLRIGGDWVPFPTDAAVSEYLLGLTEGLDLPGDPATTPRPAMARPRPRPAGHDGLTAERLILPAPVPEPPAERRRPALKHALLATIALAAVLIPLQQSLDEDPVVTVAVPPEDDRSGDTAEADEPVSPEQPSDVGPGVAGADAGDAQDGIDDARTDARNTDAGPDGGADDTVADTVDGGEPDTAAGADAGEAPAGRRLTAHETLQAGDAESALRIFYLAIIAQGHACDVMDTWRYVRTQDDADLFAARCVPEARYAVRIRNSGGMEFDVAACADPEADADPDACQ